MDKMHPKETQRIRDAIKSLLESIQRGSPTELDVKKLRGKWAGFYSLRVGVWRVVFRIEWEDRGILVYNIAKRENVYE
jgi:mRNA interferase RelE/StbE